MACSAHCRKGQPCASTALAFMSAVHDDMPSHLPCKQHAPQRCVACPDLFTIQQSEGHYSSFWCSS